VPDLDVVDETFLAVPPKVLAAVFAEAETWRRFWPDLAVQVYADRGAEGLRWTVGGALVGTMEVWLEPVLDGTVLHYFLRADLPNHRRPATARDRRRELTRRQLAAKAIAFGLKAELECGRRPGCAPDLP
jgi:hypothetical protein